MKELREKLWGLVCGEGGATSVEYAVMLVMIIAVCVITIVILGLKVENLFNQTDAKFGKAITGS